MTDVNHPWLLEAIHSIRSRVYLIYNLSTTDKHLLPCYIFHRWGYANLTHMKTVVDRNRASGIPQVSDIINDEHQQDTAMVSVVCVRVCVCVCLCVCVYWCVSCYTYTCTHTHTHTQIHTQTFGCM